MSEEMFEVPGWRLLEMTDEIEQLKHELAEREEYIVSTYHPEFGTAWSEDGEIGKIIIRYQDEIAELREVIDLLASNPNAPEPMYHIPLSYIRKMKDEIDHLQRQNTELKRVADEKIDYLQKIMDVRVESLTKAYDYWHDVANAQYDKLRAIRNTVEESTGVIPAYTLLRILDGPVAMAPPEGYVRV